MHSSGTRRGEEWTRTKHNTTPNMYNKMSNNVQAEIEPIGTLQDFSATHLGHYETFRYGLVGTVWDIHEIFWRRWKILPPGALRVSLFPRAQ